MGKYLGKDIKDKNNVDLIVGAGFDITEEQLGKVIDQGVKELNIVNIDPINKGPYILESLKIDKNTNKVDALNDIYKVLRPGEAPSIEIAEEVFSNLYFKKERYDLSEVGRVKLNSKLDLNTSPKKTILETTDITAIILSLLFDFENFVKILAEDIGSEEIAAAVGPVKYFSRSFFGVSFKAIFVILFFVILNKIPFSLNSLLKASSSLTFRP